MRNLKKDLQAVTKGLKALTRKTEALSKKVAKLEKAQAAAKRKPKAKVTKKAPARKKVAAKKKTVAKKKPPAKKKAAKLTATDQVLNIIKRSKKGVDAPTLMKKTGLGERTVRNILFKAGKQRKIKRAGRGVYVAT
jgi:septal ring factor EnvC (AmiA/AmiB activator)